VRPKEGGGDFCHSRGICAGLPSCEISGDRRNIPAREFAFPHDVETAAEWFSVFFDQQIIVRYSQNGFPDAPDAQTLRAGDSLMRI
jgi:hypothetical protein